MPKRATREEFIEKAEAVHGKGTYDYSKVVYVNNNTKVEIACPEHGSFWMLPRTHTTGHACPKCKGVGSDRDFFIKKATKLHGEKYTYDKVEYVNVKTKVVVTCPLHGGFLISPNSHLSGHGCYKCAKVKISDTARTELVCGVGVNDSTEFVAGHKKRPKKSYEAWNSMLHRCYDNPDNAYKDCSVCEEWLTYSNFAKWFDCPDNGYREGYDLDKDILVPGNRVYSPNTCLIVPGYINTIFIRSRKTKTNGLPIGVHLDERGKYRASIKMAGKDKFLGAYATPDEAFLVYKKEKERYIQSVAVESYLRGDITEKVYNALMAYEVYP